MPVAYEFDGDVILLRMSGIYTPGDMQAAVLEALDDEHLPPHAVMLLDLRESSSLQGRTADDVRDMARFLAAHAKRFGNRFAAVAESDLGFGLMRVAAVTAETAGMVAEVFRDIAAAREWLTRETITTWHRSAS
jgi:hypothetical protein